MKRVINVLSTNWSGEFMWKLGNYFRNWGNVSQREKLWLFC